MLIIPASDSRLKLILQAQLRAERLRAVRTLLLTLLAVDGVWVWFDAAWPRAARAHGGLFALLTWPICFVWYLLVRALEYKAERQVDRRTGEHDAERGPKEPGCREAG